MKAIVCTRFGPPEALQLSDVEKPIPKDGEVLVKVIAASLNSADLDWLKGSWMIRLNGLFKPKHKILGSDIAGIVEAVGKDVNQFQPGDEVFVDLSPCGFGALAEFVCIPEDAPASKPAGMTFVEAAAYPQAAVLAVQGLQYKRQVQPGQKVLINGAGGGVGTFAVQIAKFLGAEVTGVDSTEKQEIMRSVGADYVIDYTCEDFTKNGRSYDLILDVIVRRPIPDYVQALNPSGILAMVGGSMARILQAMLLAPRYSKNEGKEMGIVMHEPNKKEDLLFLEELFTAGKVRPVIDKCYKLSEVPEAFRYFHEGHVKGKVVIDVAPDNKV